VVHQVGTQDGFLPPAGKPHHCEPWRVTWRRFQCYVARKHVLIADEVRLASLEDWQNAVGDVVTGERKCRRSGAALIIPFPLRN
jgi:hypothetical protein